MGKSILSDIWRIKGELDDAVFNGNAEKILDLQEEYKKLLEEKNYNNNLFISYNHAFWNEGQRKSHYNMHKREIATDIETCYKRIATPNELFRGKKVKISGATNCLAVEIWIIRAMFNDFLRNATNEKFYDAKENMILGKAILERLNNLPYKFDYSSDINSFKDEVAEAYKKLYGDKKPKIDYSQFFPDYVEFE